MCRSGTMMGVSRKSVKVFRGLEMPGWDPSYISNFNHHYWADPDSCSPSINHILAKYGHDTEKQKRESASKTPGRDRQS